MHLYFSNTWQKMQGFLFGSESGGAHYLRQRLLIANLWVILATVVISALLLIPFGENEAKELLAGFMPYAIANVFALRFAYGGKLRTSLFIYTAVTFTLHAIVIMVLQQLPPHMLLGMVNFILLYGVVMGHRPALFITFLTIFVGMISIIVGNKFSVGIGEIWDNTAFKPVMGWKTESISLFTTTLSTGFLVITSVELQNRTRAQLTQTLTQLRQAQTDLEMRHARAEGLAKLGAKLAVATTPSEAMQGVAETLDAGLTPKAFELSGNKPDGEQNSVQFGKGPNVQWVLMSGENPEDSKAFVKTIAELHDSALNRMNSDARLAEAARMEGVGRLAASVAHDFNNLLVPIRAAQDFLDMEKNLSEQAAAGIDASKAATTQAVALVDKLLTHAKARASAHQAVNLNKVIKVTEPLLRTFIADDVSLNIKIPSEPVYVNMDPVEVEQLLLNLVLNAKDAVGKGGVIVVSLQRVGELAVLSILDDGPGIPPDLREWVLGAFHTTSVEGTGLGLSTVNRIAEDSGGTLEISEGENGGALLTIRVPTASAPRSELTSPPNRQRTQPSQGLKVLIVDDDVAVGETMADLTQSLGHESILVDSGHKALKLIMEDPSIDLILTDYQMGEFTGEQLLQKVRSLPDHRPVAIITGYGTNLSLSGPYRPTAVIAKPIGRVELGRLYQDLAG